MNPIAHVDLTSTARLQFRTLGSTTKRDEWFHAPSSRPFVARDAFFVAGSGARFARASGCSFADRVEHELSYVTLDTPFEYRPRAGHIFSANSLPSTADVSHGFFRRFLIVRFTRDMEAAPGSRKDAAKHVIASDIVGIAAWAIEGAARLQRQGGFTIPPSSEEAISEWRRASNSVLLFIDEKTSPLSLWRGNAARHAAVLRPCPCRYSARGRSGKAGSVRQRRQGRSVLLRLSGLVHRQRLPRRVVEELRRTHARRRQEARSAPGRRNVLPGHLLRNGRRRCCGVTTVASVGKPITARSARERYRYCWFLTTLPTLVSPRNAGA